MRRTAAVGAVFLGLAPGCRGVMNDTDTSNDFTAGLQKGEIWHFGGRLEVPSDAEVPKGDVRVVLQRLDVSLGPVPVPTTVYGTSIVGPIAPGDSAEFGFVLPAVPPDDELYVPDSANPNYRLATYIVGAFVDHNRDGVPTINDSLVGATLDLLVYADDPDGDASGPLVAPRGWHLIRVSFSATSMIPSDPESLTVNDQDLVLPANLLPTARPPLEGLVLPPLQGGERVDLLSVNDSYGGTRSAQPTLLSKPLDGPTFSFQRLPDPPADQFFKQFGGPELVGAEADVVVGIAYRDVNGNGVFDDGTDLVTASSIRGDEPRMLVYLKPLDFLAAAYDDLLGASAGWMIVEGKHHADTVIDWSEGLVLSE